MVKDTLVESWIQAGLLLTQSLDEAGFPVVASFWFYDTETNEWQLKIASPAVDKEGPLEAYRRIQIILRQKPQLKSLSLNDISVLSPKDELVRNLRMALRTGRTLTGIRFTRNRVGDEYIEDAYVYRVA